MRTITKTLYKFEELSEEGKQKAIEKWREVSYGNNEAQWIYDEAHGSVKEFLSIFPVETSRNSWLEPSFQKTDDNLMELSGLRLRKWFINNAYEWITKRKYLKHFNDHKIGSNLPFFRKNKDYNNGNKSCFVYSRIERERSCVLTGICYDDDLLRPLYKFLEYKDPENMNYYTFEDIIRDCFSGLKKSLEAEEEYIYSDEGIAETIKANEYEFYENGSLY